MGKKTLLGIAAVVAAAGLMVAAPAQASPAVTLSIGTGVPAGYGYPAYGYVQPGYVYAPPAYVYRQPSYVYSPPVYIGPHRHHRHGHARDRDRDGVPNRFDRRPNNPRRF